jgi:hypothetical protein
MELFMEKRDAGFQTRLDLAVRFRPVEGLPLRDPREWRAFCESILMKLQSFLMANR